MMQTEVFPLFSTPVFLSRAFSNDNQDELTKIALSEETLKNVNGNYTSVDNYVLDRPELSELKQKILSVIDEYVKNIACWTDNEFYITQSWFNINPKDTGHHHHYHSNSILSGCYYIRAKDTKINFHAGENFFNSGKFLALNTTNFNVFNSPNWFLDVEAGNVVIFPSATAHSVDINKNDEERISVAFNIFVKGTIGNQRGLTELKL